MTPFLLISVLLLLLALLIQPLAEAKKRLAGHSTSFCVLQTDGQVYCVGDNGDGNLGIGSQNNVYAPTKMLLVTAATDVAASNKHTCIVDQGGVAKCTGSNYFYYLLGNAGGYDTTVLDLVAGLPSAVSQVFCSGYNTCVLLQSGGARCWGYNGDGMLGIGNTTMIKTPVPITGYGDSGVADMGIGGNHICFITISGKLYCIGDNPDGQLGDASTADKLYPVAVQGLALTNTFVSVACGEDHTCAVTSTGAVLCWGNNYYGQLGIGIGSVFVEESPVPVQTIPSGAVSVWANGGSTFAIMQDGTVQAWGLNAYGELGTGNSTTMLLPTQFVPGVNNIQEIRGGDYATCILTKPTGRVRCLGYNHYGQLSTGTSSYSVYYELVDQPLVSELPSTPAATMIPTKLPTVPATTRAPIATPTTLQPTTLQPTTPAPSQSPVTLQPTTKPSQNPTLAPSSPTQEPTRRPSKAFSDEDSMAVQIHPSLLLLIALTLI